MMKIVSILLQVLFVSAGALAGQWLKAGGANGGEHEAADAHAEPTTHAAADAHGDNKKGKDKKKKKKKKKDDHGGGHGDEGGDAAGYMKFSRQFIVPVIRRDNSNALLVIDINLEMVPDATERAYSREPKIRDALLSTLLALSNEGAFENNLLADENVTQIRARLLEAAQAVQGEDVLDVLILSIARQDF